MLKPENIQKLKQNNISKDPEKTKQRVKEIWSKLPKPQRAEVLALADISKATVERTYKGGHISAKLAAAMAQTLELNPRFLTGEADDKEGYTEALLLEFLNDLGYKNLPAPPRKQKAKRRPKPVNEKIKAESGEKEDEGIFDETDNEIRERIEDIFITSPLSVLAGLWEGLSVALTDSEKEIVEGITDEDLILLIQSASLQAKFNSDKESLLKLLKFVLAR